MANKKKYWLHRINNCKELSYPLFEQGYLTLGWSRFTKTQILIAARNGNEKEFEKIYSTEYPEEKYRGRWSMWYFARLREGDTVVVPLDSGMFSICKVLEEAKPIWEVKNEIGESFKNKSVYWDEDSHLLKKASETNSIDLGFVVKIEQYEKFPAKRIDYADCNLTSRMKILQTNAEISDIEASVEESIEAVKNSTPINFYESALKEASSALLNIINKKVNPTPFEKLIKAYMSKIGADFVYIPAKNESGKEDGADADIVALFETLKIAIIIQAKHHKGITDEKPVNQIQSYKQQLEDPKSDLTIKEADDMRIIPWVISSCDDYSDKAKERASEYNIRLIAGQEFARMLIDAGLSDMTLE